MRPLTTAISAAMGKPRQDTGVKPTSPATLASPTYPQYYLIESANSPAGSPVPNRPCDELLAELRAQVNLLEAVPDLAQLTVIESIVASLKRSLAARREHEADGLWIDAFFNALLDRCVNCPDIAALTDLIESSRAAWSLSGMECTNRERLEFLRKPLDRALDEYCLISDQRREKDALVTSIEQSIAGIPIAQSTQRQDIRSKAAQYRQDLSQFDDRLSKLEIAFGNLLQVGTGESTRHEDEPDLAAGIPDASVAVEPMPEPELRLTPVPESPSTNQLLSIPGDETASPHLIPVSTGQETVTFPPVHPPREAEFATAEPAPSSPACPQGDSAAADDSPTVVSIPEPAPTESLEPVKEDPSGETGSNQVPSPEGVASATELLAIAPGDLNDQHWARLAEIQRSWLDQRQSLRAWLLTTEVERRLAASGGHVEGERLLSAWACRLLLVVADRKLPLAEEDKGLIYGVRDLSPSQRELVVLWITAALLENATDKPLRLVRAASPQQFDVPPHSLADICVKQLLTPVINGGSLSPPRDRSEFQRDFERAIQDARDILNPSRNNYQNTAVKNFWRDVIAAKGAMGQILTDAKEHRFPPWTLSADVITDGLTGWDDIRAAYRNNMHNRMEEFAARIEGAKAANNALQQAPTPDRSALSQQVIAEIQDCIHRQPGSGWWLKMISTGLAQL